MCNNFGLLLNIDWVKPYKQIEYSVGVMYLVILNLPHPVHFKRENVILFGVIPGPCEPPLTIKLLSASCGRSFGFMGRSGTENIWYSH